MAKLDSTTNDDSITATGDDPKSPRGAAGSEGAAHGNLSQDEVEDVRNAEPEGTLEDRRETQQVTRPTTDGLGEGLVKDQG